MKPTACLVALLALAAAPDVIPPGHKSVEHLMVVEVADQLEGWRFIATPIRGFGGVQAIGGAQPFPFSSKYGTRIYALERDEPVPEQFDRDWCAAHRASPGFAEVRSVPVLFPLEKVITTYRITAVTDTEVVVEQIDEQRSWGSFSVLVIGTALGLTILLELIAVALLGRHGSRATLLRTTVLVNLVTHPIATALVIGVPGLGSFGGVLLVELAVLLAEAGGYHKLARLPTGRALVIATVANLTSYLFGLLFWTTLLW